MSDDSQIPALNGNILFTIKSNFNNGEQSKEFSFRCVEYDVPVETSEYSSRLFNMSI